MDSGVRGDGHYSRAARRNVNALYDDRSSMLNGKRTAVAYNPDNLTLTHTFGSPFSGEPTNADSYYATLGRLVVVWGRFEQNLESLVWMLSGASDVKKPAKQRHAYKQKIVRLRELCDSTPSLSYIKSDVVDFIEHALDAGYRRHALIHANWQGFVKDTLEPTVRFSNIRWEENKPKNTKKNISLSELQNLTNGIHVLNEAIAHFMMRVATQSGRSLSKK